MNSSTAARTNRPQALFAGPELERRLETLLAQARFPPPPDFFTEASIRATPLHTAAEEDANAFWAEQARRLHWDVPFTTVLDDSNPPSTNGSPTGSSTSPTTASIATSPPAGGSASRFSGSERRARNGR